MGSNVAAPITTMANGNTNKLAGLGADESRLRAANWKYLRPNQQFRAQTESRTAATPRSFITSNEK